MKVRTKFSIFLLMFCFIPRGQAQEACLLPDESLPGFMEAFDAKDTGDNDRAIALMESLLTQFQGSPAPYYILGNWYYEAGQYHDAKAMYLKARTALPG